MTAEPYVPASHELRALCDAVQRCEGCGLYRRASQAVFGEGDPHATIMFIGEQPGDEEDRVGHPFVGPAGHVLDRALHDAGIEREHVWVTNAVKHFKFADERRGKRIHEKPTMLEVNACRPWLDAELQIVDPETVVLLGATAAQALLGREFRITRHRGEPLVVEGLPRIVATWHPSAVLRAPDDETRHRMRDELVSDLRTAAAR